MRDVSPEGAYSRNLSFAQGIKGIGSTLSTYLISAMAGLAVFQWRGAFPLFFVLMALAFLSVASLKIEETKADKPPSLASSLSLLKEPIYLLAVVGIFLYVGAESCMSRFLNPTLQAFGMDAQAANKWGPTLFFLMLTIGRLLGGAILAVMSPRNCLSSFGAAGSFGRGRSHDGSSRHGDSGYHCRGFGFCQYLAHALFHHNRK